MLILREREKLIQAIIYFAQNTRFCGKVKLFKLLYFLDFEHFKYTGRSVTGLEYAAWKMGPVPTALFDEINAPEPDMASALEFVETPTRLGNPMLSVSPKKDFENMYFSRREMRLMEQLVQEYREAKADDLVEATHLENKPWDKVFNQEKRQSQTIPYEYALRADESEQMRAIARDREELIRAIG